MPLRNTNRGDDSHGESNVATMLLMMARAIPVVDALQLVPKV